MREGPAPRPRRSRLDLALDYELRAVERRMRVNVDRVLAERDAESWDAFAEQAEALEEHVEALTEAAEEWASHEWIEHEALPNMNVSEGRARGVAQDVVQGWTERSESKADTTDRPALRRSAPSGQCSPPSGAATLPR